MESNLHTGRTALVTGGGRGIGAATARLLALEGGRYNIAAIGVYPGIVDIQMQKETRNHGA